MPIANHLFRREAVYYWRCRLPRPIGKIVGRTHLARSLRTKEPDAARRLARRFSTVVDELTERLTRVAMSGKRLPTEADLGRILDNIFTEILEAGEQNRAARPFGFSPWTIDGDADPEEQQRQEDETDPDIGWNWRVHLRHNRLDEILPVVERQLDERNLAKPQDDSNWRVFLRKAMATHGAALDIESEREQGIYRPVQHPFAVMGSGGLSILGMEAARQKVSEMFEEHIKIKNAEGKWKAGSDSEYAVRMALKLFLACKGDLPFAQILAPDAWDFRTWLCALPSLVGKSIYTGLDYNAQITLRETLAATLKEAAPKATTIKVGKWTMTRDEAEANRRSNSARRASRPLMISSFAAFSASRRAITSSALASEAEASTGAATCRGSSA